MYKQTVNIPKCASMNSLRLTYNAYEGDDGSEGDLSLAQLPVTHGHAVRDLAEADGGRDLHEGVPAQEPQH